MKYIGILSVLFLLVSCSGESGSPVGNKTTMEVEELYDAGKVIKGEIINAKFTVKNTGDYPLIIAEVTGSCSCTVASYPDEPIEPGETGEVLAQVNTDKTGTGLITKKVNIVANTKPSPKVVQIRANVQRN